MSVKVKGVPKTSAAPAENLPSQISTVANQQVCLCVCVPQLPRCLCNTKVFSSESCVLKVDMSLLFVSLLIFRFDRC